MRTILVTGAAGFIGSHLCEALVNNGHKVIGLDNFDPFYGREIKQRNLNSLLASDLFQFIEGDAGSRQVLDELPEVDLVVHLAAKPGVLPSIQNPEAYIRNNIGVSNVLLEWMKDREMGKLVFASSSSVYGNNSHIPFSESDAVDAPISPYAFTKRSCELMHYTYHSLYGFDIMNLRFFTVYGERQRPDLAIHKFVRKILNKEPITIYGDGSTSRDYTYYRDTVNGILAAIHYVLTHEKVYEIINLGNHSPVKLIDLVLAIGKATGMEPWLQYESMKAGDVDITYAEIEKAATLLNYHPATSLDEGLAHFVKWYREMNPVS